MASLLEHARSWVPSVAAAMRGVRRSLEFSCTTVAVLSVGVGIVGAFVTFLEPLVLRSLPYDDARVVVLATHDAQKGTTSATVDVAQVEALRATARGQLDHAYFLLPVPAVLEGTSDDPLQAIAVSWTFGRVLGLEPILGRTFEEADVSSTVPPALISHRLWLRAFGGAAAVLDRQLVTDRGVFAVIGVLPRDFVFPSTMNIAADLIFPTAAESRPTGRRLAIARLEDVASLSTLQATARAQVVAPRDGMRLWVTLTPLRDAIFGVRTPQLLLLLAGASVVLAVAFLNVWLLSIAHGMAKASESKTREALGATRSRLVRESLMRFGLLGLLAAVGSTGVTHLLSSVILAVAPLPQFAVVRIAIGMHTVAIVLALAVAGAVACGAIPYVTTSILAGTGLSADRHRRPATRRLQTLIAAQVSFGMVLLAVSWASVTDFAALRLSRLGVTASDALVAEMNVGRGRYSDPLAYWHLMRGFVELVEGSPLQKGVAAIDVLPLYGARPDRTLSTSASDPPIEVYRVSGELFQTLGVPLLAWRTFSRDESLRGGPVAIANEAAAQLLERTGAGTGALVDGGREIVGIVGNVRGRFDAAFAPALYIPFEPASFRRMTIVVAPTSARDTRQMLKGMVTRLDARARLDVTTVGEMVGRTMARERFQALALSLFAGLALALLAVGLYCTNRYVTSIRLAELAVRATCGATPFIIGGILLRDTIVPVGLGLAGAGIGLSVLERGARLFLSSPLTIPGPWILICCAAAVTLLAAAMALVVSRQAMSLSLVPTLRHES